MDDYQMKLDLHGVPHAEVERTVENFILTNQDNVPLTIITGNSKRMQDLVFAIIFRINCDSFWVEQGSIRVDKV